MCVHVGPFALSSTTEKEILVQPAGPPAVLQSEYLIT